MQEREFMIIQNKENENYKVYIHTNKINGKYYVGITCKKYVSQRWRNGDGYKKCPYFNNAIQKYDWNNFDHEVIARGLTKEEAENFEILLISKLKSNQSEYGYNIANGGNSNGKHSQETIQKIREANLGKNNHMYGKHLSEEHKQKIRQKLQGEKCHNYGKDFSTETRKKMSIAKKDIFLYGDNPSAKQVYCDGVLYSCIKECAEYYDVERRTMNSWLLGKTCMPKFFYDLDLKYFDENIEDNRKISKKKTTGNMRPVECGNVHYSSLTECANHYMLPLSTIHNWLTGFRKMPEKFIELGLRYAE